MVYWPLAQRGIHPPYNVCLPFPTFGESIPLHSILIIIDFWGVFRRFTYIPRVSQSASNNITPAHWPIYHSLNHLIYLKSIQSVQQMHYLAKSITWTISALTGTHLTSGWREAIVSCSGRKVSRPGLEPTLCWTERPELEFNPLICSDTIPHSACYARGSCIGLFKKIETLPWVFSQHRRTAPSWNLQGCLQREQLHDQSTPLPSQRSLDLNKTNNQQIFVT